MLTQMHTRTSRSRRFAVSTLALVIGACTLQASSAIAADPEEKSQSQQLVDAFNQLSGGPHAGFRANHAKGVLATGTFTPSAAASTISKAGHLQSGAVPVTVRFSNSTGVPDLPDAHPFASPHGMAIRFQLPDGTYTDIVAISVNRFPVSSPDDLLALLKAIAASGPDAPKPTPIEQFMGAHPETLTFITTPKPAPQSYGTIAFFGVNAFRFINATDEGVYGRYRIIPVAGDHHYDDVEAAKLAPSYLVDELGARLAKTPIEFRLQVQLAKDGDSIVDATKVWPDDRPVVELGTLKLTSTVADDQAQQRALAFNPLILPEGIEPSLDPVLLARPGAYAVSVGQRNQ